VSFVASRNQNSFLHFKGEISNKNTTAGSLEKKSGNKHHEKKIALSEEKTARSALIGIKPEELLTVRDGG